MSSTTRSTDVWTRIEQERRRDRFVRSLSVASWTVTIAVAVVFSVMTSMHVAQVAKAVAAGALPAGATLVAAMPLVIGLGILSLLAATLSTVGVFLRLRTASLGEIQLRLAALEQFMLVQTEEDG